MTMLLESKFFQPRPRQEIVLRPRLLTQLQVGLQRKLILILAQAGFGKSTLAAHWLNTVTQARAPESENPTRVAWLSLDDNDNDPLRFFDYLITALQRADPTVGQHARYLLSAPQAPTNLEPLIISLINDLTNLSGHLILALDDYHTITSQEVHQIIHTFISHAPDFFHLLILSRVEPPLPLTRWRMYRELIEIREHDLRFTLEEAQTFLLDTMHCAISPADVAALEQRTEGWIVGLHLAALSLQSHPNVAAFIADFTGSHAYIVDYLTEEVLHSQPPEIQEFLFQTARLTRFSSALCDAVLGRTGSQRILEHLERSHLFVIPLDNERGWYRYHHLFSEMLRRRAAEHAPQDAAETYRRATQWHLEKGLVTEAIEYALAGDDPNYAAALIERTVATLIGRGQIVTLVQWLDRLPLDVLQTRPLLCATRARIAMRQHKLDAVETWLAITDRALDAQPQADLEVFGIASAIRVDLALNRGQLGETIRLAQEALAILPEAILHPRGEILFFLGVAYFWESRLAEAVIVTTQAAHLATRAGDTMIAIYAHTNIARYTHAQGKLRESMAALEQVWALASTEHAQDLPFMGSYHNNVGQIFYEWNLIDAAGQRFLEALQLAKQGQNPRTQLRCHSLLLSVYQATIQRAATDDTVRQMQELMHQYPMSIQLQDECNKPILKKWLGEGNFTAVAEWIRTRGLPLDAPDVRGQEPEYVLIARYLAAQNDLAASIKLLEKVAASASALGKLTDWIETEAFHALVLHQQGDGRAAFALLTQVLEAAEPHGFIRTFVDEGKGMHTLLTALQPRLSPRLQNYAARILQGFGTLAQSAPTPAPVAAVPLVATDSDYVERLSERELEVLRLVEQGLSDSQIAAKLVLAIGTVKRHLNNIYGKLGVHNRTHALARARTLQLL